MDKEEVKEYIFQAIQATKQENSGLIGDIKISHKELKAGIDGINARLDKLNGSVAKHTDKLADHDIINAQVTITQNQLVSDIKTLKEKEEVINNYKLKSEGSINTIKWLLGFIGFGTIMTLMKVLGIINI